jgi:hypothetical protein
MRFLEERAESLVILDESEVRMVRKDPYNLVKYKMFNGLRIRYLATSGKSALRVEEEDGGRAFLLELDGHRVRVDDTASVAKAIIEHATMGSADPLFRLWRWHAFVEELGLTVRPTSGVIDITREGVLSILSTVRVDVIEHVAYHDGSKLGKLVFAATERNDWLYRAFRNHSYAVALVGRDETGQVWMHYIPPEYRDRTILDCEIWLAGGEEGDRVLF